MTTIVLSNAFQIPGLGVPRTVREREILRVTAGLGGDADDRSAAKARKEVLKWVRRRVGAPLPRAAWQYGDFEKHMGGRDCRAIRIVDEGRDLWAIRANDPDKTVARRVWATEIFIGHENAQSARFGLRLLASAPEGDPLIVETAVPGILRQLAEECGLYQGATHLTTQPWIVESKDDTQHLIDILLDPSRREPVFVLSVPSGAARPFVPLMDPAQLARALIGIARTVVLPDRFTWDLTERLGKKLSAFGGAIRAYLPGFTEDTDPYSHPLFLAERLSRQPDAHKISVALRQMAAAVSLRKIRLGHDVLSFSSVQTHSLAARNARLDHENATAEKKLEAAQAEIRILKESLKRSEEEQNWYAEQHDVEKNRADEFEKKWKIAKYRNQQLTTQLANHSDKPDSNLPLPDKWENFSDWCETHLSGRVELSPRASREVKAPSFGDVAMAGRCLLWLANDYRHARIHGSTGDLRRPIENGLRNDQCGGDAFKFDWRGKRVDVEWHIKNGGNTREPSRCLRIYYFWDEADEQVVIASMPAHIRTGAT